MGGKGAEGTSFYQRRVRKQLVCDGVEAREGHLRIGNTRHAYRRAERSPCRASHGVCHPFLRCLWTLGPGFAACICHPLLHRHTSSPCSLPLGKWTRVQNMVKLGFEPTSGCKERAVR